MNMKKYLTIGVFSILFLNLLSCDSEEIDGRWDDNIKLSEKNVSFTAELNSTVITTEGAWWWISGIRINDDWSYDLSDTDTSKENFVIEETEFRIERKNATEIHISMQKNQSNSERVLTIGLQAGNYFDGIKVTQSAN